MTGRLAPRPRSASFGRMTERSAGQALTKTLSRETRCLPPELWPKFDVAALRALLSARGQCRGRNSRSGDRARLRRPACAERPELAWTYAELIDKANRIAEVLKRDFGLSSGGRVLLRGYNTPMLAACWFGVLKAGGIAVTTMPLLRARELGQDRRQGGDQASPCAKSSLADELEAVRGPWLKTVVRYLGDGPGRARGAYGAGERGV